MNDTKQFDVFFNGILETVTPFSYTEPDLDKKKKDAQLLPSMGGKLFVPASSIRGSVRRNAVNIVYDELSKTHGQGFRFPMEDFHLNILGGVKGGEDKEEAKKEDKTWLLRVTSGRPLNPLVSLFGAMAPSTVPGKLAVEHAISQSEERAVMVRHVRTDDLLRGSDEVAMLDDNIETAYAGMKSEADARSALKAEEKKLKQEIKKASGDEKEILAGQLKEIQAELADNGTVQVQQVLQYQVMPAGTKMRSGFRLMRATEIEIVLFLKALDRFALNPVLGGRKNHGLGVMKGSWDVTYRPSGGREVKNGGKLSIGGDFLPASVEGKAKEWLDSSLDLSGCDFSAKVFQK